MRLYQLSLFYLIHVLTILFYTSVLVQHRAFSQSHLEFGYHYDSLNKEQKDYQLSYLMVIHQYDEFGLLFLFQHKHNMFYLISTVFLKQRNQVLEFFLFYFEMA